MDYQNVIELVKQAAQFVFDDSLKNTVDEKGEADFVTAVDLKISAFLRENLARIAPEIGFMSEEEMSEELPSKRWILDPIDGTTNLIYDYNMSSVSLALYDTDRVIFGIIYNPFNQDLFLAKRGCGASLNGKPLFFAQDRPLEKCLIEFGAGSTRKRYANLSFDIAKEVFKECLDIRRICSSALAIAYVAAGKLNGYFEKELKPWDYAAAVLLLEECGAMASDWDGKPLPYDRPSSFVCGTPKAYSFLLKKILECNNLT